MFNNKNKNKNKTTSSRSEDMWQNLVNTPMSNPSSPASSYSAQSSFPAPTQPLGFASFAPIANPYQLAQNDPRNNYQFQGWYQTPQFSQNPQFSPYPQFSPNTQNPQFSQYPQFSPNTQNPQYSPNTQNPENEDTNFNIPETQNIHEGEDEAEVETEDLKKKRKQVRWTDEETRILAERWVHASENGVQGNSQTDESFWKQVEKAFNSKVSEKRNINQLTGKWNKIAPDVKKFNAIFKHYNELHPQSGAGHEDVLRATRDHFKQQNNGRKFIYEQCWYVLKEYPKFFMEPGVMNNRRTFQPDPVATDLQEDDVPMSSSLDTNMKRLFQDDLLRRPPGRKAQKSSGSSDAGSSSRSLQEEKMETLEAVKQTAIMQQNALKKITENSTKKLAFKALNFLCKKIPKNASKKELKMIKNARKQTVSVYGPMFEEGRENEDSDKNDAADEDENEDEESSSD